MSETPPARSTIVTGGASGIGLAVVDDLRRRGHAVTVFDLTPHPDADVPTETVDVTDESAVSQAVDAVMARQGRVNGLVASHGIRGRFVPAMEMTLDDVRRQFDIHVLGAFVVAREIVRRLDGEPASLVLISSTTAYGGWSHQVDYGLAKAAVRQLTQNLAIEWAPMGVRVNAVAPGHTRTPMVEDLIANGYDIRETEKRMPLGRLAQPSEMAVTIAHLLDEATFVTGQCVAVDGGWTTVGR
ncbi:SDR family NAD(P)-dependent oxidoreductase [Microcella pacifica]|uniref:SDR family NAD(P)-dependent oxidoreductase n=1 Tax=Microcella pacifica TaxID=2591847 RepID=UPI00143D03E3|nr:SDR family oxidoreductase [Microcella pacifica]